MKNKFNNFTIDAGPEISGGESVALSPEIKKQAAEALNNEKILAEIQANATPPPAGTRTARSFADKLKDAKNVAVEKLGTVAKDPSNTPLLLIGILMAAGAVYYFYFRKK